MEKFNQLGNIEVNEQRGYALFSLQPKIYPLEDVKAAVKTILDRACVILDGDPEHELLIEVRTIKPEYAITEIIYELANKLLNTKT